MYLNFKRTTLLCSILLACSIISVEATDYFVSQPGGGDGSSSTSTLSLNWLNAETTWGAGANRVSAGDVVHLVGTFTNGMQIHGGGAAGNPITILFENNASFTAATWMGGNNGIHSPISGRNVHDVVIDGGNNGRVEATANGLGLAFTNLYSAIDLTVAGSLEIKNLTLTNLVFRTNSLDESEGGTGIYIGGYMTNVLIHNNWIEMTGNGITLACSGYNTNVQVYSNTLQRISWGCFMNGDGADFYGAGFQFWANRLDNFDAWDEPTGTSGVYHNDGLIVNVHVQTKTIYDGVLNPTNTYGADGTYTFPVAPYTTYLWGIANLIPVGTPVSGANYTIPVSLGSKYYWVSNALGEYLTCGSTSVTNTKTFTASSSSVVIHGTNIGAYYSAGLVPANDISLTAGAIVLTNWSSTLFTGTNTSVVFTGIPNKPVTARLIQEFTGTNYGIKVYRNLIGPHTGRDFTCPIYLSPDMNWAVPNAMVYNNVVVIGAGSGSGNGFVVPTPGALVANNTFINLNNPASGTLFSVSGYGISVYNNLNYKIATAMFMNQYNSGFNQGFQLYSLANSDYNIYYGLREWAPGQGAWPNLFYNPGFFNMNYTRPAFEGRSSTNKPSIGPNYAPLPTDTVARGMGKNLSSYFTDDFNGNPRPATGPWTIGAFEVPYNGPLIIAPSSLRVTNN